jgi:hypothetical protein
LPAIGPDNCRVALIRIIGFGAVADIAVGFGSEIDLLDDDRDFLGGIGLTGVVDPTRELTQDRIAGKQDSGLEGFEAELVLSR